MHSTFSEVEFNHPQRLPSMALSFLDIRAKSKLGSFARIVFKHFLAATFIFIFSMIYSKYPHTIKQIKAKVFLKPHLSRLVLGTHRGKSSRAPFSTSLLIPRAPLSRIRTTCFLSCFGDRLTCPLIPPSASLTPSDFFRALLLTYYVFSSAMPIWRIPDKIHMAAHSPYV